MSNRNDGFGFLAVMLLLAFVPSLFCAEEGDEQRQQQPIQITEAVAPKPPLFQPYQFTVDYTIHFESRYAGAPAYISWKGTEYFDVEVGGLFEFRGPQIKVVNRLPFVTIPLNDKSWRGALVFTLKNPKDETCTLRVGAVDGTLDCPGFFQNASVPVAGSVVKVKILQLSANHVRVLVAPTRDELEYMTWQLSQS